MELYKPKNKKEREARRRIWERFCEMRDDPLRKEAEQDWEEGRKEFLQYIPERELGDWRSHLVLPDAFAGVQAHMQETIDRRSRPILESVENSDQALESFCNAIMRHNMDRTGFDYEQFMAKETAAIEGTAWSFEFYRYEKRDVHDPTDVKEDGTLVYTKKEIIDVDDTFTVWYPNERVYIDPGAMDVADARDQILEEIIDWNEFQRVYGKKNDFINVKLVPKCGAVHESAQFFKKPKDMSDDDVQVLHYYNRSTDSYDVLANNVVVRMGYLNTKHKELPGTPHTHYKVPGRIWGLGIPKVIKSLTAERTSLRNLAIDRQNMQINKMFLVNDLVDLDDEDFRTRPNGMVSINTNGLPIDQIVKSVDYGDIPASYYKAEDMLLEDIRRAHGIDERSQSVESGGTATGAAITQQSSQRRIALINTLSEMDTLVRIGRLKWSNIQFFYPAPRVERIMDDNGTREKKVYRTIKTQGQEFKVINDDGNLRLQYEEIDGNSGFKLDKRMASFMQGDMDVVMTAEPDSFMSKPLRQAKITEMMSTIFLNPQLSGVFDPTKSAKQYLKAFDFTPRDWLREGSMTDTEWKRLAIHENMVMAQGQPLAPTPEATEIHTEEHLNFMNSKDYDDLVKANPAIDAIFQEHVFGEHQNNPNTGNIADLMQGGGGAPQGMPQGGQAPEMQAADIEPSTVGGSDRRDAQQDALQQ